MWSEHFYLKELQMAKSIFEQLGATYELQGDYFTPLPCLTRRKRKACGCLGQEC